MTPNPKPPASLSLDLDNEWSYLKTRGEPGWERLPSYLDLVVPRVLSFLAELGPRITVFVVGQDAALERHHAALRAIAEAGHEIGNHSFRHEPWLRLYSETEVEDEIRKAEEAIVQATGRHTKGFRGPGYSLSAATLRSLVARGYAYDGSTLPTFLGPAARAYYFLSSPLDRRQRRQRRELFGRLADGFQPIRPYAWEVDGRRLIEIPVTTLPGLRLPFHFSYVLYLCGFSELAGRWYFNAALSLCAAAGLGPSLLLHPLDFLDGNDVPSLRFFPAMKLSWERKRKILKRLTGRLAGRFQVLTMEEHSERIARDAPLHVRKADTLERASA